MKNQLEIVAIRMIKDNPLFSDKPVDSPKAAVELLGEYLCELDREVICVINLRSDGMPINCNFVSVGALNECMAHPREIFKTSILSNAASMLLVHNHPSGNLKPSTPDTEMTDKMLRLCDMMGIPLLDHVIVGGDNTSYFSYREKDILNHQSKRFETNYMRIQAERFAVAEPNNEMEKEVEEASVVKQVPRRRSR